MADVTYPEVFALADILGVNTAPIGDDFDRSSSPSRPQWDGETLWFDPSDNAGDLFHELVHWTVAEPGERAAWDFGLGPSATFSTLLDAGTNPLLTMTDGRAAWAGQLLLPAETATARESDACHGFLLLPNVTAAGTADAIGWWGLYGGDYGMTFSDTGRAALCATLHRLTGLFEAAGVPVHGTVDVTVDAVWEQFSRGCG